MQNRNNQPHDSNPFANVAKCEAKNRKGNPCQCPAMKNGRCRLHGGLSTGPRTPEGKASSGNWKHGYYSKESKAARRDLLVLCRQAEEIYGQ